MFDFSDYNTEELSIKNILSRISEVMLWRFYINTDFIIGKPFSAPHRKDVHPSFSLKYTRDGRLCFKDFGRGNYGDIFDYLILVYSISYAEALNKVNNDFGLNLKTDLPGNTRVLTRQEVHNRIKILTKKTDRIISNSTIIQIMVRDWKQEDLDYWNSFGISIDTLRLYSVYPVKKVFCNKRVCYIHRPNDPAYGYYFPKSTHIKIYYPMRESFRFLGNVNNYEDIQGYYQCKIKKGLSELVLTKSMKDVMLLREFGYNSMAINGENHYFQEDFIRHIKKYCSRIVSLYDKDHSGIIGSKNLWDLYKIEPYFIPKKFKSKDVSDLYKNCGKDIVENFLKKIINA